MARTVGILQESQYHPLLSLHCTNTVLTLLGSPKLYYHSTLEMNKTHNQPKHQHYALWLIVVFASDILNAFVPNWLTELTLRLL